MRNDFELMPCRLCGNIPKIEKRKVEERIDCRPISYISVGVWCNTCWFGFCNHICSSNTIEETNNRIERILTENTQRWNTIMKI